MATTDEQDVRGIPLWRQFLLRDALRLTLRARTEATVPFHQFSNACLQRPRPEDVTG